MLQFLPTKREWMTWPLTSKYSAIGLLIGFISLLVTLFIFFYSRSDQNGAVHNSTVNIEIINTIPDSENIEKDSKGAVHQNKFTPSAGVKVISTPSSDNSSVKTNDEHRMQNSNDSITIEWPSHKKKQIELFEEGTK
jgi:hypothetical protein